MTDRARMPLGDKVFWIIVALFAGVIACKGIGNRCTPTVCNVCSFIGGEWVEVKQLKEYIPDINQ